MRRADVIREIAYTLAVLEVNKETGVQKSAESVVWLLAKRLGMDLDVTQTMVARTARSIRIGRATRAGETKAERIAVAEQEVSTLIEPIAPQLFAAGYTLSTADWIAAEISAGRGVLASWLAWARDPAFTERTNKEH